MRFERALVAVIAMISIGDQSLAQPPAPLSQPARRPAYSPYLNLTRPGGTTVQNYYGLVRPEIEFRNSFAQLRQDNQTLAASIATPPPGGELSTGHSFGYMTHQRYFGTNRAGGAIGQATRPSPVSLGAGGPRPR